MRLLFCGSGWLPIVDHIAARLPTSASIAVWDRGRPLTSVVEDVDVILPSNGRITDEVIAAARRHPLVATSAASSTSFTVRIVTGSQHCRTSVTCGGIQPS